MKKKTSGLLIGAAGLGLAWTFRERLLALFEANATIVLKTRPDGSAGIGNLTDSVKVRNNRHVTWTVINNATVDAVVSLQNWNDGDGNQKPPAANADPDENDRDQPSQEGLSRRVPAGKRRKIRGRARPPIGKVEDVHYDVFVNGQLGVDPIVRLVL